MPAASGSNWQIEQQCPQCGAPVTLDETDRLFLCGYCRTKLYLASAGPFRYYIPPPPQPGRKILFVPYWRLKGLAYRMADLELQQRFVDTNILALDTAGPPASLGLRPQAMKLHFVSDKTEGRFLAAGRLPREAAPRFDTDGRPTRLADQAYIGGSRSPIAKRNSGTSLPVSPLPPPGMSVSFQPFAPIAAGTWRGKETPWS
jgi:hypothetical protein